MSTDVIPGARVGDVIAGKYRVDRILGVGGMGMVVQAHHLELDERVAIKLLLPEALAHSEAIVRFMREARAAVKIKSEHVARVFDVGRLDSGAPFMVMECLDGSDLSAWLIRQGPLSVEQAIGFLLQACEAIAEAHALGIVHRDLKPSNLFVIRRPDGGLSCKVLDFGISKVAWQAGSGPVAAMTKTSAVMGSPLYMSPEQMQSSRDVDARSDIWSLGVILYELISGHPPFVAETMPELVIRVVQGEPVSVRTKRPEVPAGVETVINKCLDKQRDRRYESVAEFSAALLPFGPKSAKGSVARISGVLRAAGLSATALALPASDHEALATTAATSSWGKTASQKTRAPFVLVGGLLLAGALGAVAFRALTDDNPSATRETTSAMTSADAVPLPSPAPATSEAPPSAVAPLPPTATPSVVPSVAPSITASASATASTAPIRRTAPRPARTTRPAQPKPNCDPPFTIDAKGHKVPKAGCL